MRINNVVGLSYGNMGRNVAFSRKLKENEKEDYGETVNKALDCLGIVNRALIIHGPSFPADKTGREQKIGSPYANPEFLKFAKMHGFNSIQLGPMGKFNRGDVSPYTSSVFAKNPLFISLAALKQPEYASILSEDEVTQFTKPVEITNSDHTRVDFNEAQEISNNALSAAYDNFQAKLGMGDSDAQKLNEEFIAFQKDNEFWIDNYAVLDSIAKKYGTDDFTKWAKEDAELITKVKSNDENAIKRYNQIKQDNEKDIGIYKFSQFLVDKQSRKEAPENIAFIGDLLVGASHFDELAYSDVFLKDYKIGAQWGGVFNSPQLWGISLLDPNKLFDGDNLGPSGIFLKEKLKKAMSDAKNIRIDHVMGLVNPYVYRQDSVVYSEKPDNNGKMTKYPLREELEANYLCNTGLDPNHNFEKVLEKIVIPTMQEMGIDPKTVVWEDLGGDPTGVFDKVFRNQLHLNGISGMIWTRGENVPRDNWAYVGCHDNLPAGELIKDKGGPRIVWDGSWDESWNSGYLSHRTTPSTISESDRMKYKSKMEQDPKELVQAKWVDLLRSSKNIQISFMDFFGIQKPYNTPGTTNEDNWTLRLNPNYEDTYHKSLENHGWAINMPKILEQALVAQTQEEIDNGKPQDEAWGEVSPVLDKLRHYDSVLQEKE